MFEAGEIESVEGLEKYSERFVLGFGGWIWNKYKENGKENGPGGRAHKPPASACLGELASTEFG